MTLLTRETQLTRASHACLSKKWFFSKNAEKNDSIDSPWICLFYVPALAALQLGDLVFSCVFAKSDLDFNKIEKKE